mgnify:CR=1 FL=1
MVQYCVSSDRTLFLQVPNGVFDGRYFTINDVNEADHEKVYACTVRDERGRTATASARLDVISESSVCAVTIVMIVTIATIVMIVKIARIVTILM